MDYHEFSAIWKRLLEQGLADDAWVWDWTSIATAPRKPYAASVVAKADGVWAAEGLVAAANLVARDHGFVGTLARSALKDGARVRRGQVVARFKALARLVLALERPFLNLAAYASGISTKTFGLVKKVRKACPKQPPRVTSTRKILPAYRDVAILAVMAGGGVSHRVSLSGGVLIKENHIAAAGGIAKAVEGARRVAPHGLKIETEVRNLDELAQALAARADGVLLDNFTPTQVKSAIKLCQKETRDIVIEASGGLDEHNIAKYALPGVHVLSVGSLTHSVKITDLSLLIR
jgi:nicotinate-nucleotide pyrophosphorylase (carboxylating)